ncbi:MAG: formylglycine-generating enzyme family protein [bacterium]|nr:formylglycine-generating enzyme family protein [bacterium]
MRAHGLRPTRTIILALWFLLVAGAAAAAELAVSNVQVTPLPFSASYDISYDLQTVEDLPVTITLLVSSDGGLTFPLTCTTVSGDVGDGVLPGIARHIVWNAAADAPGLNGQTLRVRVEADDHRGDPVPPTGFAYVPAGTFEMGSPVGEPGRATNESLHPVTLTRGFFISKYEVTMQRWYEVMGGTPSTAQIPMNYIAWDSAVRYCNALSALEGLTPAYVIDAGTNNVTWNQAADGYRLPTEAEWEYACRAGTVMAFHNDTNCLSSDTEANYRGNTLQLTGCALGVFRNARLAVGSFPANAWGLYDMHGNILEWVWDTYRTDYQNLGAIDPVCDLGVTGYRVFRGGRWNIDARYCRSAYRYFYYPGDSVANFGLRPVRWAP